MIWSHCVYEKRLRKKQTNKEIEENAIEVDPVDALPVKTLDGKLYYRTGDATGQDLSVVKLTKAEKRAKLKKLRKEAKKQVKEEVEQTSHAEVLEESNIKSLREMLEISKDGNREIVILGLKSFLAVFKDTIPGYRIRLPTEKEPEMKISKEVQKMRLYESTLLSAYKRLIAIEQQTVYKRVSVVLCGVYVLCLQQYPLQLP
ncbi:unnamed protein product [Fraxinus pennsylvanica]|uniref:Nucleolar complex-associated protein 3 N-terminal domain-containing protein n=1 Tax=Fraxinus pennsylvanica TaxID=56036 RepID=A0AAD2E2X3_9LAMI|nr:unnamed protein product [Fraxinus pennsylvanica]